MFAGLATLGYIISFVLYAASAGSKPFDYAGVFIISSALLALHFFLGWDYRPWNRGNPPA